MNNGNDTPATLFWTDVEADHRDGDSWGLLRFDSDLTVHVSGPDQAQAIIIAASELHLALLRDQMRREAESDTDR